MQKSSPRFAVEAGQTQVLILAGIVILILALAGGIFLLGRISAPKPQNVATSPQPFLTPQPTSTPADETIPTVQIGYETVKLHSGKNSFELEVLVLDSNFRPTQAKVYDAYGKLLKTYTLDGPWTSLCFENKEFYKAIGTMDEIPGYKNVEIFLVNNMNVTKTIKQELGKHCRPGTVSIE